VGSPGQPWQLMESAPTRQAKFGQYLQDAKKPRSLSQTEQAVECEQISSNGQVLPMPVLEFLAFEQQSPGIYFINIESI
jgi:hypothetical protein